MKIYIQSRGYSPDFEYCWQPEVPPYLSQISGLIQSESPSVVLVRFEGKLLLLVTGLESSDKKDFRDRSIRHSAAWTCSDNSHDESNLRAIAAQALRGLLNNQIDKHIRFGGEYGFEASFSEMKQMSESLNQEIEQFDLSPQEAIPKIGKNSEHLRDDLAYQLERYSLPKGYEFLIVATGIKSEEALEKATVWRSLSNLVKSENWRDVPTRATLSERRENPVNFPMAAVAIVVAVILAVALGLTVVLLRSPNQVPEVTPSPTPTISSIKQTPKATPSPTPTISPTGNKLSQDLMSSKKDLVFWEKDSVSLVKK